MKQRKRLGLDIDGTITNPATFVPYLNRHFKQNLTLDDLTEYDLASILQISDQQFWEWMDEYEATIYEQAELVPHVKTTLNEWAGQHDLIYITARRKHLKETTHGWFRAKNLPFNHIELVGKHDKLEAIREHQIDIFFEDKHDNAVAIAEEFDIPVILFDTPYNRLTDHKNVIRVKGWEEAKAWVHKCSRKMRSNWPIE